ncbi:hypothetical protein [Burkholderia sp. Bp9142]|uniref:hypothetical protein n=1 Tax=Burkholderia sp. Bp9142 TaxID=2184573 RepID=UPI000F5A6012|nr:hypothetical protein [Burkholderia sp. Bp9142]
MKLKVLMFVGLLAASTLSWCRVTAVPNEGEYFNLSVRTPAGNFDCLVDKDPVEPTLSSDGSAVILAGTDYIPVNDLNNCKNGAPVHSRRAAPHVSFLSDINIKAGIYASMVPITVSPLSFVAVVGRIGSDRGLVEVPGFYRVTASKSKLKEEASSNMNPVISLDGRYVSLGRYRCEIDSKNDIIEIKTGKLIGVDGVACVRLFNWNK